MSIYDNITETKATKRKSGGNQQKVDPSKILNDKNLTEIVKDTIPNFKTSAKEVLYDMDGDIVGVLQKDGNPYLFDDTEVKHFKTKFKG